MNPHVLRIGCHTLALLRRALISHVLFTIALQANTRQLSRSMVVWSPDG